MARTGAVTVVGLGLAGTALTWALLERNVRPRLVHRHLPGAASPVAAGLITPVTGHRLRPQHDYAVLFNAARAHYAHVASLTGTPMLREAPALRLLNPAEEARYTEHQAALASWLQPATLEHWVGVRPAGLALAMPQAARVDLAAYLSASRRHFERTGLSCTEELPADAGLTIWCCGFREQDAARCHALGWRPAKGEVLEFTSDALRLPGTLHAAGIWVTPLGSQRFLAGATYTWDTLDDQPTHAARDTLCASLDEVLAAPYAVTDQRAGVRPIVAGRRPVVGRVAPAADTVLFNGLGSKGTLFAPWLANRLVAHLLDEASLPDAYRLESRCLPDRN